MGECSGIWPAIGLEDARAVLTRPGGFFAVEETEIAGVPTRVWANAPATVRDLAVRARSFSRRECLIAGDTRIDFEGFIRAALAIAAALRHAGLRRGDRVALAMRNRAEWPAIFVGASLAGAIVAPLNAWWTADDLSFGLEDSGARFAFFDSERLARIGALPDGIERAYLCDAPEAPTGIVRLEDLIGPPTRWADLPPGEMPDIPVHPDDALAIFYTSGTTMRPRGVLLSHRAVLSSIMAMGYALAHDAVRAGGVPPEGDFLDHPQRGVLLTIPLFHVLGACAVLFPSLYIGAKLVLMAQWSPEEACRLIERETIAQVWGVPSVAWELIECPARADHDLSSLRLVTYGGAPFSPLLAGEIRKGLPRVQPGCGWGMTETAAICTSHSGRDYLDHPASCGLPAPVCDLKVMSLDGARTLGPGETGELWAKGPNVATGYWNRPEETAFAFHDGWVRTGDVARLDADGFCTIVDRVKDMLIRGGENISCVEVEHALCEHPAVSEAAVVPIDDHVLGEQPGAVVRLRAGRKASEADLKEFLKSRLAAFKVPVRIAFLPRPLPRNAAGKLVRGLIKQLFPNAERKPDG